MWPELITDFTGKTPDEIVAYRSAVRAALKTFQAAFTAGEAAADDSAQAITYADSFEQAGAALKTARRLVSVGAADLGDDSDDAEVTPEADPAGGDASDGSDGGEGGDDDGEGGDADGGEGDPADNDASDKSKVPAKRSFGAGSSRGRVRSIASPAQLQRPGTAGGTYDSWAEIADACAEMAASIDPGDGTQRVVARIPGGYTEDRKLSGKNLLFNQQRFEQDEITAAMCAPIPPRYELVGDNVLRRPVFNSLAQYEAPRGGWSVYPSPSLNDLDVAAGRGIGIWTPANDADPGATKNACQTIRCATPEEFKIYGIYRCLTVKNLLALTFPELVEAYMNRLYAAWCRLAEVTLLNAMGTRSPTVTAERLGYGGSVSIVTTIMRYIALWMERERWDTPTIHAWIPRWVRTAMKIDLARRNRYDGVLRVVSDAEIDALFAEAGISKVTWTLDIPTWASPLSPVRHGDGTMNFLPGQVDILLAPAGKFGVMDRGAVELGVVGRGVVRDNVSNASNQFSVWFENFEGLIDTNNLPSNVLRIPACWNGAQIAPIIMGCEGQDMVGVES